MRCVSVVLVLGGGVLEAAGVLLAFRELRELGTVAEAFEQQRRAGRSAAATADLRRIRLEAPADPGGRDRYNAGAAVRVVERLISAESRGRQRLALGLLVAGLALTTAGGVVSLWL